MFKQWIQFALVFVVVVSTSVAAAKISFTPVPGVSAPAKDPSCKIEVLTKKSLAEKYLELGTINYHDEWHRTRAGVKLEQALPAIQRRACQAGADAIMNIQVTQQKRLEFAFINVRVTAILLEAH